MSSRNELVSGALPAVLERVANLEQNVARAVLKRWHDGLRFQERRLWDAVDPLVPLRNPPPYAIRVQPSPSPEFDRVSLVRQVPTNELGIASAILVPSYSALIRDFFWVSGVAVSSFEVGAAEDVGPGTSDLGLLSGNGISSDEWLNYEKFVLEVKLLSPQVSHGSTERYVLFKLVNHSEVIVSRVFCRDPGNPPPHDNDMMDRSVTVMEVLMSLILLARPSEDPERLWVDMDRVREAARKNKRSKEDDSDHIDDGRGRKKRSKSTLSIVTPAPGTVTSLSIGAVDDLQRSLQQPLYRRRVGLGLTEACLEIPATESELVETVVKYGMGSQSPDSYFDVDRVPGPPRSTDSAESAAPTHYILFREYLGHGRMFDAFVVTLAVRVPEGGIAHVPAVVKQVDLSCLESFAEAQLGYPLRAHVLRAVEREVRILRYLSDELKDVAPRLLALWSSVGHHHILLAIEDCGDEVARDLKSVDDVTKGSIIDMYESLHEAGIVHGDVHARHILQDANGRLRVIDFEGAREIDMETAAGALAAEQEMTEVYKMLGFASPHRA